MTRLDELQQYLYQVEPWNNNSHVKEVIATVIAGRPLS